MTVPPHESDTDPQCEGFTQFGRPFEHDRSSSSLTRVSRPFEQSPIAWDPVPLSH